MCIHIYINRIVSVLSHMTKFEIYFLLMQHLLITIKLNNFLS